MNYVLLVCMLIPFTVFSQINTLIESLNSDSTAVKSHDMTNDEILANIPYTSATGATVFIPAKVKMGTQDILAENQAQRIANIACASQLFKDTAKKFAEAHTQIFGHVYSVSVEGNFRQCKGTVENFSSLSNAEKAKRKSVVNIDGNRFTQINISCSISKETIAQCLSEITKLNIQGQSAENVDDQNRNEGKEVSEGKTAPTNKSKSSTGQSN